MKSSSKSSIILGVLSTSCLLSVAAIGCGGGDSSTAAPAVAVQTDGTECSNAFLVEYRELNHRTDAARGNRKREEMREARERAAAFRDRYNGVTCTEVVEGSRHRIDAIKAMNAKIALLDDAAPGETRHGR